MSNPFSSPIPQATPEPSRRQFIRLIGGGVIAAAASSLQGCVGGMPPEAVRSWGDSAPLTDPRRFILAHALLAPNPHNRQPWIADLRRPDEITLICDGNRMLPETDPMGRQIYVGCGAFLELALIAAAEIGHRVTMSLFPQGEPSVSTLPNGQVIATLHLTKDPGVRADPLFRQIRKRHTNKASYDSARLIAQQDAKQLLQPANNLGLNTGFVEDPAGRQSITKLLRESWEIEMTTPRTWLETAKLLRVGRSEIERHRDGVSIVGLMPTLLNSVGMFDRFAVPKPGDSNYRQAMQRWSQFETGSGYVWIGAKTHDRISQVTAGRAYVRTHLEATARGIDLHPLSQALQEFPEVAKQYKAIHALLGLDPKQQPLQVLCRIGYASAVASPSPRRTLDLVN